MALQGNDVVFNGEMDQLSIGFGLKLVESADPETIFTPSRKKLAYLK